MNDVPVGNTTYQEIHNGMHIHGISYTGDNLNQSAQAIADICFDVRGQKDFNDYINSLKETGFNSISVAVPTIEDWQMGEGFAEIYLSNHFSCYFPWSNNRDLKNPNASLPGADLVGFHQGQLAFGEVKTSNQKEKPPSVTYDLKKQLKNLCNDYDTRQILIQYLFYRQNDNLKYREALTAYLKDDKTNFYIFGVLVRDVKPDVDDWKVLKKHLQAHKPDRVSLIALYLPENGGIQKLHSLVLSNEGKS